MELPKTTSGMLIANPIINKDWSPLAAAATPITLSKLMTTSAIKMVRTADMRLACSLESASLSSSLAKSCAPIHNNSNPPTICKPCRAISHAAMMVKPMRKTTAAPEPKRMALRCCSGGKPRAAKAITTALSPESRMLIQMIFNKPTQNSGFSKL